MMMSQMICPGLTYLLRHSTSCLGLTAKLSFKMPDILLVEDKDSLRRVLYLTLETAGYTVTEAAGARAAPWSNARSNKRDSDLKRSARSTSQDSLLRLVNVPCVSSNAARFLKR